MGNEASLEGAEGLPEGLAPDGKGGFVRVSDGSPVSLSELSEEERRRLSEAMARAQSRQAGGASAARRPSVSDAQQVGASRGPAGLSKSRTVDAFNQGPPGKPTPGRSPSSLSLFESRFRQEPKTQESRSSGMFGSSFLSGANPLSAVSSMTSSVSSSITSMGDSVNIPKFGLFGDEEEEDAAPDVKQGGKPPGKGLQQGPGPKGPQKQSQGPPGQGPKPGQGAPGQGPKQGQGPKSGPPAQGPPGQGPRPGQGPPGQGPPGQGPRPGQGPAGQGPPGQGPRPGQGPGQGTPGQGPRQGQAPPGQPPKQGQGAASSPGQQGPRPDQGGPPQQKSGPPQQGKPGPKQQGPGAHPGEANKSAGAPGQQGSSKPSGGLCPLCKTTQLNTGSKDPPNYNNCTECKSQVCSLCGFSPPDSAGKEWLCLNCQMQRAMGGMEPPSMMKPKQGSAPPSPQRQASGKPGKLLIKQQSTSDHGLTPPTTPRQKSPGPSSPGALSPGPSPKIDPKTGRPIQQKSSPQQSPAKAKQESSFFGGLGGISLGGLTEVAKPPAAAESVTGKLFGGFGGSSKPQQAAPKQEESVTGKLFGGFGGLGETAKPPAAASQMFSFGSSLLSSATSLVTGEEEPAEPESPPGSPPDSDPGSPPDSPFSAPGSPPDSDSAPDTPPAKSKKPIRTVSEESDKKVPAAELAPGPVPAAKPASGPVPAAKPAPGPVPASAAKTNCPLCSEELNIGSAEAANYSLCSECKKEVCNRCGFNPAPHLGEKEWLCLNCQTQRAMSGQLGDLPPPSMASPKKQPPPPSPAPSTTPAPAVVDSNPVVEDPTPPASETKVASAPKPDSTPMSPKHSSSSSPENTPQETHESEKEKQPTADESVSENVIQAEEKLSNSESLAENAAEIHAVDQQEEIAEDCPHDSNQQAHSENVSEILALEQHQSSCEKAAEGHPLPNTEIPNIEQQPSNEPVSEIPAAQQQQKSSENTAEDHSPPAGGDTQNLSTNIGLDTTAASAKVETEPSPEITQSDDAAQKVDPAPEKRSDEITKSSEPTSASIPEIAAQETVHGKTISKDLEEKMTEVRDENPQTQVTPTDQTPSAPAEPIPASVPGASAQETLPTQTDSQDLDKKEEEMTEIPAEKSQTVESQVTPTDQSPQETVPAQTDSKDLDAKDEEITEIPAEKPQTVESQVTPTDQSPQETVPAQTDSKDLDAKDEEITEIPAEKPQTVESQVTPTDQSPQETVPAQTDSKDLDAKDEEITEIPAEKPQTVESQVTPTDQSPQETVPAQTDSKDLDAKDEEITEIPAEKPQTVESQVTPTDQSPQETVPAQTDSKDLDAKEEKIPEIPAEKQQTVGLQVIQTDETSSASAQPTPTCIPEASTQETVPGQTDSTVTGAKEEKITEVPAENLLTVEPKITPKDQTPSTSVEPTTVSILESVTQETVPAQTDSKDLDAKEEKIPEVPAEKQQTVGPQVIQTDETSSASAQPTPTCIPEASTQETVPGQTDSTVTGAKEEKITEVPAEKLQTVEPKVKTEPSPEITQNDTAAQKVDLAPEKPPDEITKSAEQTFASIPEPDAQGIVPVQTDTTVTRAKQEKTVEPKVTPTDQTPQEIVPAETDSKDLDTTKEKKTEVSTEKLQTVKPQVTPTEQTPSASSEPIPASIPDTATQEIAPVQTNSAGLVEKEDKIPEVPAEKSQTVEPQVITTDQTPLASAERTDICAKHESDGKKPNVTDSITAEMIPSAEPAISVADASEPKESEQELKPELEPGSASTVKHPDSVSNGESQAKETPNKPTEVLKEEPKTVDKTNEESTVETNLNSKKASDNVETIKGDVDEKTPVEVKRTANADEGKKAVDKEVNGQKVADKADNQTLLEKEVNESGSSPRVVSNETENICLEIKTNESETTGDQTQTVLGGMPNEEQINKEVQPEIKSEPAGETLIEAAPLSVKGKSVSIGEDKSQKEEKEAVENAKLKKDEEFDKVEVTTDPPESEERDKVNVEASVQSAEMVSSSDVISGDGTDKEKRSRDEAEADLQNQNEPKKVVDLSVKQKEAEHDKEDESRPVAKNIHETISVSECDKDGMIVFDVRSSAESKKDEVENNSVSGAPAPVAEPHTRSVVSEQEGDPKEQNMEEKMDAKPKSPEDAVPEVKVIETLKEPEVKEVLTSEGSPTSPSDLAKLESSVLPILEAQVTTTEEGNQTDTLKTRRKLEVLPLSPESPSSEEDNKVIENNNQAVPKKKLLVPMDVRADSLEDSSESFGKESPMSGDDEEFIRKQIMEMSENEDASPSDEENLVRRKIKEDEKKQMEEKKTETVEKSASGKARRLTKKTTISPDDEDKEIITSDKPEEDKEEGLERKFQMMELNTTSSPMRIPNTDGEPEMESLTDSPDERSRGECSSSLHASSFTPGTSPTSVSSLDEDSDSSSPGHIRTGEGKQHRKAKHRQTGQMLPTIEDSSEEEELREEEELLREQEKQKGSGKKSKKDKEEIRAQRRREHSKTPPSNLSPIEDASPTEEQRQEAEMEEIRRSSCSDFSPSIESDPEGFEVHAAKIAAVQKTYQLPTSVSLHSPTDDQNTDKAQKKPLKSADETYEEIMLLAKSPTADKDEIQPRKESVYGGMLIEDYAYSSFDNSAADLEESQKMTIPAQPRKLRSPDEVYEDMIKKRKEFMQLEQEYQNMQPKRENANPEIVLQPAENTFTKSSVVTLSKDGKPLLDAEAAYEELMKRVLTPGTSPTQPEPEADDTASRKALHPIPDLKVTQCSSGELSSDDESLVKKEEMKTGESDVTSAVEAVSGSSSSSTSDQQPHTIVTSFQADVVDLSSTVSRTSTPVIASVSPLPTVPQYTPSTPSIVSTAPPVPPKPNILRRATSQEKEEPVAPPNPPPTPPKPTVFPRKAPVPLPPQASATPTRPEPVAVTTPQGSPVRQGITPTYKPHVPPPVPPKPAIPAGVGDCHRPAHGVKPPIAPKPGSQPPSPAHAPHPPRPTVLPTSPNDTVLNLSPSVESTTFQSSPKSPPSPRYASNLRDTYVVITLPSQPSSPVDNVTTQAPSSPGPASPSRQSQSQQQSYSQHHQPNPPQTTRVPLAFTRVTESIESQEICSPEKRVSSSCHIIEAISASAQPPLVMPNLISQVVTTEVQRTTVSVVHERTPPPVPAPRANGVPVPAEKPKPQFPVQNGQVFQPSEVVDLRTVKVGPESNMNGVDLSASPDSRRQSFASEVSRNTSAVQSPVVNLSTESSTVSIVTDSITIVTCSATLQQCDNVDISQTSSVPLQLTKNKAFEPVSQIIYRPIDSQPPNLTTTEIPINLSVGSSTGGGCFQATPVTIAPTSVSSCAANGLNAGTTTVAGVVDLSTTKPFSTVVSVDATSADVVTNVVTDDGKPVDLTAGKRAVCCDVVYKLPFAGSCTTQQPTTPLPEDRFGYRDDHYQYDRSPYSMRGFGGIKPSMSDTNLAEAGLFIYKSKNSYNFSGTTEGAVDLTSAKISDAGEAVDYSKKGTYAGMTIPPYSQARATSAVSTLFGTSSVLRSSNGVVYSSVAAPVPSTYAITTQPGSIFSTTYNTLSGMHTSDTMPSLSNLQNLPLTRSQSFLSTISTTTAEEQRDVPLNLEISRGDTTGGIAAMTTTASLSLDTYTDASLEAIAASLEALSSPMVPGDGQYQAERERLEMEKLKQQRLAEELEWERQEIQRFREQEQLLVQKELEELQVMKQQILAQQEEERQAHLMMQKETYAQQQQQLEQIQKLQEQLRIQLEEQKYRQMYPGGDMPGHGLQEAIVLGPDGTVLARKITDSGCQTDEEDETVSKAYTAGRKKRSSKKSVDSCVQTDDEDQEEWEAQTRSRQSRPRTARGDRSGHSEISLQAHTEISIQTDKEGNIQMDARMEVSDSERTSPKKRPTPLEITRSPNLKPDSSTLQAPPKSPKVLYSPISPCISPSKSLEFVSYDKPLGDTSPQKLRGNADASKASPASPRGAKTMQRSMSDPKPMSPTGEERATSETQYGDSHTGKGAGGTPTGTQKKVKRTLPNPPSEEESTATSQTAYSTGSARRRMCRNSNMARAKILQDIDRELDLVERESSKLRKRQAELDEEEKEIDAKLRYLEMGINRRKDALLKEREKRERAYLQSVAEDRDYMSDSEVSNIRETRGGHGGGEDEEMESHGLERPRTAPQSDLDDFVPPQTKHEYGKYSQYQYPQSQYQQSIYQTPQSYQSHSIYSSVPSLTTSQQQSYHQMLLLQQKAARQAALLSELDATKYDVISRQPDPTPSAYLGVKYDKYGNHLDLRALEVGSIASSPVSAVSDSYYTDVDHHTPRSYMLLEDAAELAKTSTGLSSSYSLAERELAKAEKLLRRSAADLGSTDYLGSTSRLHTFGKTPDEEDTMEEPYELKLLKQQLKQEFRRSTGGNENLEQLTGLSQHYYTPSSGISSYSQRHYPKSEKYSISRLTLEKQAAKQLPASMLYQKHKTPLIDPKISSKYSSMSDSRGLETDYTSYLGSTSASPRSSRLMQDEITFGLRKNIAEQQKYLGSTLGANLAGSLNLGQSLGLDSAYPSGSRSRPSSRPTSCYGLDLSIKRDVSSSSLRLKGDNEAPGDGPSYQTPSGRTKPTSLPIVQSGRGRIPIVAQNSEEESPLSPVGQPMGMARASAGPLPPISADSRDQFGSCLSLQDSQQQQHIREEPTRGRGYALLDDLQGTMSDSEAYHLRREETDWFDKPRDGRTENGKDRRQGKGPYYPFPHLRVKLQRDPKDRSVSGNGLGIRVVGGKEVPGSDGEIGAYVAKVLPGGTAEQTGKILEGMQVLEWNSVLLTGKTYEEVQGLVGQLCNEAEVCVRLDLNMLAETEGSQHLDVQEHSKGDRPPRSPGVDPKQLAAELQKVSQQQAPTSGSLSSLPAASATSSPGQPGSPSVGKKRHGAKTSEGTKIQSHPISGEIQLQIHYDKQLGNLIVHVLQARNLAPRDNNGYSDPFVKVYLLPGRGAENKRKSKHAGKSLNPEWNQTVIYKNIHLEQLRKKTLEVSVWDYDKGSTNDFLGEVLIDLSNTAQLDNVPRWLPLKEQSEGDHHRRSHSGQGRHGSSKPSSQHSSPKTTASLQDIQDSPKSSVIKSRSHGIFPDPAKDTQVPTIEKSHSSPGTSKPSPSEGQGQGQGHSRGHGQHSRSHGASRSGKSAGTTTAAARQHQQDSSSSGSSSGGAAMATAEAQQQSQQPPQRLQPSQRGRLPLRHQRHSVAGVLTIQRAQSDWLPSLPSIASGSRADGRHLTLRKAVSEERPQSTGARSSYRSDAPVSAASLDSGLSGSAYSLLDEEEENEVDSAIFQVPRFGKIPNGTDVMMSSTGHSDSEGKTQVMGEIKIALKKEMKTEGEHLVLEILQCRNITFKFKSPDHLPDLYVKLYVVNIATQKRIIKKKTRVCRHDREPSFNETFRFCMNPTGHSLQLFLVSNGGKFMKKTLIGEAYVWLDKMDLRKRVVSWHKLFASTAQIHS